MRVTPWVADRLVCPYDGLSLSRGSTTLQCPRGHAHRIVSGIPILLRDDVEETHWHATQAREAPDEGYPSSTTNGINDYAQKAIAATGGYMYRPVVGRLTEYPIPAVRLPPGRGRTLLDLGCNWGRWSIATARAGYRVVGIDPSLPAVQAAYDVAKQLGVQADFVVGDARFLPFANETFDAVFSYSVLQHFSKSDVRQTLTECARVLNAEGFSLIQMANALGLRSLFHQARRRFREPRLFQVRYWTSRELEDTLSESEAEHVLTVMIDWGRYAELFAYDHGSGILSTENPRCQNLSLPGHHPRDKSSFILSWFKTDAQVSQSASSTLLYFASNGLRVAVVRSIS